MKKSYDGGFTSWVHERCKRDQAQLSVSATVRHDRFMTI